MPYIEPAHIGNIPVEAISRILIYDKDTKTFKELL